MDLLTLLEMSASGFADRVVIGSRRTGLSAAAVRDLSVAAGTQIRSLDAGHVLHLAGNTENFATALFGSAAAGVPFLPLNYRLADEPLADILHRRPGLILADAPDRARRLAPPTSTVLSLEQFRTRIEAASSSAQELKPADPQAIAVLLMTSGTTAAPKSAVLRHHHLTSYVMNSVEFAGATAQEATVVSVPPYHIAAVANLLSNLYAGRRIVYLDRFSPAQWLDLVRREQISNAMVVPTMLARIVRHLDEHGDTGPSCLRALSYGGARVPATVLERALQLFPQTGFTNAYGLTETSSSIAVLGPQEHRSALAAQDPWQRARLGSVGRALPGVQIQIRDPAGRPVPAGTEGEIVVRGGQVAGEYLESGTSLSADGWFSTRDRGRMDEEGFLFVRGRADDTIIRGGENIAPAEIEEALGRHEAVEECAVAGLPDDEWGQVIAAFVVLRPGHRAGADELRAYVRDRLRGSRTPDEVHFLTELPATATGKILRRDLVADAVRGRATA